MARHDQMVAAYLKMRDARTKLKKEFEEKDGRIKDQMRQLEAAFLEDFNKLGMESSRTEYGLVYTQEVAHVSISDWGAFAPWIIENDALEFMERRIKVTEVKNYMEECSELPPGVSLHRENQIRIRRS